jgi:hypothetical protein
MTAFIALGAIVALAGLAVLVTGLRTPEGEPKRQAMMIGGTMAAAFGIVIAGFALAYDNAALLDVNSAGAAR